MDYGNDADPMISSAIFPSEYHIITQHQSSQNSFGVLDFDSYSRPTMILDDGANVIDMHLDSPESVDTYHESDMELGFQDSHSVASSPEEESNHVNESAASTSQQNPTDEDLRFEADRLLVNERFRAHDLFPVDNTWSKEDKVDLLMRLSPCKKYTREQILNIDSIEDAHVKIDMLIDLVEKVRINFRWNYVDADELKRSYTVVTNCKKEKKKDADGQCNPKRPMNAFMIWSKKCRSLIAHISPQLHNAMISAKLGKAWRLFSDEEKAIYEREKEKLTTFHTFEFPDYKYKPRKKTKKTDTEKPAPAPKPKTVRKRKAETSQPSVLRGVNIADTHQNLSPQLKERLQVKIDPDLKKGIGRRATAIDLTDLTSYHQTEATLSPSLNDTTQRLQTTQSVHLVIDNQSSVFDTPGNSPNTPITPVTPTEQILSYGNTSSTRSDTCFDFDDKSMVHYAVENNNNLVLTASSVDNNNIKSEPNFQWSHIKPETQDFMFNTQSIMKTDPDTETEPGPPILTADCVEEYLKGDNISGLPTYNNSVDNEDLTEILSYLGSDTDIMCAFPEEPSVQFNNMLGDPSGLLQCKLEPEEYVEPSVQLHYVPEGPATV